MEGQVQEAFRAAGPLKVKTQSLRFTEIESSL
jgi:hypothetical protein